MTMRRLLHLTLAVLTVMLAVGACGDDKGPQAASTTTSTLPPAVDKTVETNFRLEVTGDASVTLDGRREVRVYVRKGKGETLPLSVVSITLPQPVSLPDGRVVSPELGLTGMYEKDGTYTVPAGLGTAPRTGTTVATNIQGTVAVSVVHVTILAHQGATSETRFGYLAEPCTVTYQDNAMKGRAECPAMVSYDGKRISMKMAWGD